MKKSILMVALLGLSGLAFADSFWLHNGSVMRLVADGNEREFYYETPSKTMRGAGVDSGTLLFNGVRQGNQYRGTMRVFSKYCDKPLEYTVQGTVKNERTIVMKGKREVYAKGCRPTGKFKTDTLTFTYQSSE